MSYKYLHYFYFVSSNSTIITYFQITSEPLPNGDVTIPVNEWEHMVLTMDRMKREIRELKRDNSELKRDIILVKQAMQSNGWNV